MPFRIERNDITKVHTEAIVKIQKNFDVFESKFL